MRTSSLFLVGFALTGCVRHVPIIVEVPRCAPALPAESCASPVNIQEGSTYAELLTHYQTDRQNLESCALEQEYLRKAIATCNGLIDEHNQRARPGPDGKVP
jgi:hypothetical protein